MSKESEVLATKISLHVICSLLHPSSDGLTDEPVLPRYRRIPIRINEGALPHHYTSPEDRYRHAYFEALEQAYGEIEKRFDQSDLPLICDIESLLVNAANGETVTEITDDITKCFRGRIDVTQIQLSMLPDAINTAFATSVSEESNKCEDYC